MPVSHFPHAALAAVSAVVPANAINLEDELEYYGGSVDKARRLAEVSGLSTRRIAPDGVTASDLCFQAASRLITETGVDTAGIGALLFVSHSADYLLPASAAILQARLGLPSSCATMDMNVGCAGFVKGLWTAAALVQSGACDTVLLLVGDTPNRFINPANRVTSPVFGDAGTAALVRRQDTGQGMSFMLGSDGGNHEALVIPGGGSRIPYQAGDGPDSAFARTVSDARGNPWSLGSYCQIWMDGMAIYSFGVSVVPRHIREHLHEAGQTPETVDALLLHQANKVIIESIAKKTGFPPDKVPFETLPKYGNLGSSSIPALICEHFGPGGIGQGTPRNRVMLCGFGAGLAWGSCILSLEGTRILSVSQYQPPEHTPSRDTHIARWHSKFSGKQ